MSVIHKTMARGLAGAAFVHLALFAATAPYAEARHRADKPAAQPVSVIAHLPLAGDSVNEIFLQEQGGAEYLYLGQGSQGGVAIVDVTKPSEPSIIKRMAWPNQASNGKFEVVGHGLAIAGAADNATAETPTRGRTLVVLDLSDPRDPKAILSLSGVTGTLADDARSLVYITNSDGLWILKHPPEPSISSETRRCLSEDAFNELASCQ
jgi:hypothetical protein